MSPVVHVYVLHSVALPAQLAGGYLVGREPVVVGYVANMPAVAA